MSEFAEKEQNAYASAGAIAEEVIGAIRTVVSFGAGQLNWYIIYISTYPRISVYLNISVGYPQLVLGLWNLADMYFHLQLAKPKWSSSRVIASYVQFFEIFSSTTWNGFTFQV